ncbi:MAG: fibronectin type III domain-containing protein [Flavitalea sp.]
MATTQTYKAAAGTYKAKYDEKYGCGSNYSPNFVVVNAAGIPKPPPATLLQGTPISQTVAQLTWINAANPACNETGFEIYRGITPGGPYTFINTNPADSTAYTDSGLAPNTSYYYLVRAVNGTGRR